MAELRCQQCDKKLSRKTARLIDGKVLCSACVFPVYCKTCGKPKGAKGYLGAECQCNVVLKPTDTHSIKARP